MTISLNSATRRRDAFTLIEVMIAITIFFMAMFAILGVLTSGVRAATLLRNNGPTASMVLAQIAATNKLDIGDVSGTFHDVPIYENYHWKSETRMIETNGLFEVIVVVFDQSGKQFSTIDSLLYRPESAKNNPMGLHNPGSR